MRIRRALIPLLLVATSALAACGGDDGDDEGGGSDDASSGASEESGDTRSACEVLTVDEVAEAVGSPVKEGIRDGGPAITGGRFSSCRWLSDDPENPADTATLTIYPNTDAADSARSDDAQDAPGIGDKAFTDSFASIWVYVGEESFFAQWSAFDSSEEENAPLTEALAKAAVENF